MKLLKNGRVSIFLGLLGCCFLLGVSPVFCKGSQVWDGMTSEQVNQWVDAETRLISGSSKELTPEQLQWGEKQLRQMLKDRPSMAPYVHEGDDLWNWTVRQFAGETSHVEVRWDDTWPKERTSDRDAGTYMGPPDTLIHINVTANFMGTGSLIDQAQLKGTPKSGPVLWYETIFELFNSQKSSRFIKVCQLALSGKIDRETFILEADLTENDTRNQAFQFYRKTWISHCQALSLPYQDSVLEKQLKGYDDNSVYYPEDRINDLISLKESNDHYRAYGQVYDNLIVPFILKK
jgi:hypothetical protein